MVSQTDKSSSTLHDQGVQETDSHEHATILSWGTAIGFVLALDSFLVAIFLMVMINYSTKPSNTLGLHPQPVVAQFTRMSIASSSELCNELTRIEALNNGSTVMTLTGFMFVCQWIAEPHSNGVGGSSSIMHVKGDEPMYDVSQGHAIINYNGLEQFAGAVKTARIKEVVGTFSVAIPMALRSLRFVTNKTEEEGSSEVLGDGMDNLIYLVNHLGALLPVTRSLSHSLHGGKFDFAHHEDSSMFDSLLADDLVPLDEGDLFPPIILTVEKARDAVRNLSSPGGFQYAFSPVIQELIRIVTNRTKTQEAFVTEKEFWEKVDRDLNQSLVPVSFLEDSNVKMMMPLGGYTKNLQQSENFEARVQVHPLATSIRDYYLNASFYLYDDDNSPSKMLRTSEVYSSIFRTMLTMRENIYYKTTSMFLDNRAYLATSLYQDEELMSLKYDTPSRYYGSYAAIVDHTLQEVSVLQSSLGSAFGSLHEDSTHIVPNNMMASAISTSVIGMHNNDHTPAVLVHNQTIVGVYVGPGGDSVRSFDIIRMLQTFIFRIYYGVKMEHAVRLPLITRTTDDRNSISKKFPMIFFKGENFLKVGTEQQKRIMREEEDLPDEAVLIEGTSTMFYRGKENQQDVMPQGLDI